MSLFGLEISDQYENLAPDTAFVSPNLVRSAVLHRCAGKSASRAFLCKTYCDGRYPQISLYGSARWVIEAFSSWTRACFVDS